MTRSVSVKLPVRRMDEDISVIARTLLKNTLEDFSSHFTSSSGLTNVKLVKCSRSRYD